MGAGPIFVSIAAVSCSPDGYRLGGVGLGSETRGKVGRAWYGAWLYGGGVVGKCGWGDFGIACKFWALNGNNL